jgi:hypothetical protein
MRLPTETPGRQVTAPGDVPGVFIVSSDQHA